MDQHTWVRDCLAYYRENGLTPEPGWEEAHYPAPRGVGEETVWMTHSDHQVQGLLQSEEYKRQCFFSGDAKKFLSTGPFVPEWFLLWELYDKWTRENGKRNGKNTGPKNLEAMHSHENTRRAMSENGKKTGHKVSKRGGQRTAERMSKPVVCVETGARYSSMSKASSITGVGVGHISRSCHKSCRAGGYHWKFV